MDFNYLRKTKRKRKLSLKHLFSVFLKTPIIVSLFLVWLGQFVNSFNVEDLKTTYILYLNNNLIQAEIIDVWEAKEETEEDYAVYGFEYIFSHKEFGQYTGVSFGENYKKVGEKVRVLYAPSAPHYNRIEGMRVNPNPLNDIYIGLSLVLIGLIMLVMGIWRFIKRKMYLERGILVWGRQVSVDETADGVDNGPTFHYKYIFEDLEGKSWTMEKSGQGIGFLKEEEQIVYIEEYPLKAKIAKLCGSKYLKIISLEE